MTEGQRAWGVRAILAALLIGMGAWVSSRTEWAEVEVRTPPRGEAAHNRHYATQALLRRLGVAVSTPADLAQMPPAGATLLLTSWHWDFTPERSQRLQHWVEGGGHLVLFADTASHKRLVPWLPVTLLEPGRQPSRQSDDPQSGQEADREGTEGDDEADDGNIRGEDELETSTQQQEPRGPVSSATSLLKMQCHATAEPENVAPYYPEGVRRYELCGFGLSGWTLRASAPVSWSIDGPTGPLLLRVAQGRGSVTVIQPTHLLDNDRVLRFDNALAAVAALQARRGAVVWFVAEEARPSLPVWLWQQAPASVLLAAAAIGMALWRGAKRFGPLAAAAPTSRRSMAEQIAGTSQFLRQQGPEALLAAQIQALELAARGHIVQYERLDRSQRAAAIAQHTGQDAAALASALDKSFARKRHDLPATIERLETARRLLVQKKTRVSRPSKKD